LNIVKNLRIIVLQTENSQVVRLKFCTDKGKNNYIIFTELNKFYFNELKVSHAYYTIPFADFCRSECEFLLTCKTIITEAEG
jgi:hypothetical protein